MGAENRAQSVLPAHLYENVPLRTVGNLVFPLEGVVHVEENGRVSVGVEVLNLLATLGAVPTIGVDIPVLKVEFE